MSGHRSVFSWMFIFLLAMAFGPAAHAGTKLIWEIKEGLENPESAVPDAAAGVIYVSNVAGGPNDKNGKGFITSVSPDGKVIKRDWATGLNAPKGLALTKGKLYAADIDELVEIDTKDGKILKRYPAKDAKFLNDVAADASGNVYVSDMLTDTIWKLSNGKFDVWLQDKNLEFPNGLLVEGDHLRVAAWGVITDGFSTKIPGHLKTVDLGSKKISSMGDGKPAGNLDGVEPLGGGDYLVTDWMAGKVFKYQSGKFATLLELGQGAADLGYARAQKTMYLPHMLNNTLQAYKVE